MSNVTQGRAGGGLAKTKPHRSTGGFVILRYSFHVFFNLNTNIIEPQQASMIGCATASSDRYNEVASSGTPLMYLIESMPCKRCATRARRLAEPLMKPLALLPLAAYSPLLIAFLSSLYSYA